MVDSGFVCADESEVLPHPITTVAFVFPHSRLCDDWPAP